MLYKKPELLGFVMGSLLQYVQIRYMYEQGRVLGIPPGLKTGTCHLVSPDRRGPPKSPTHIAVALATAIGTHTARSRDPRHRAGHPALSNNPRASKPHHRSQHRSLNCFVQAKCRTRV